MSCWPAVEWAPPSRSAPSPRVTQAYILVRDLKATPRRELLTFEGGDPPQSGPCDARSAHGFLGLDAEVVAAIARWITEAPRP